MTYGSLQTFSDKSALVTKSLEYLGEVLKYIKPYLGKKISSAGLQLTYGIMGMYFWHVFARNISLTWAIRTQVERDISAKSFNYVQA